MIPRNPNKPPKVKKQGVALAEQLGNRIRRALRKVPAECRSFVFPLVKITIAELEAPAAVVAEDSFAEV